MDHSEKQNTTMETSHRNSTDTTNDDIYKKDAQGQYSKACGRYSKAVGRPPDAWHARYPPTGRFVDSGGRAQCAKKEGEKECFCFQYVKAITVYHIITLIQILSTDMKMYHLKICSPPNLLQLAGERRPEASRESRDQLACGH